MNVSKYKFSFRLCAVRAIQRQWRIVGEDAEPTDPLFRFEQNLYIYFFGEMLIFRSVRVHSRNVGRIGVKTASFRGLYAFAAKVIGRDVTNKHMGRYRVFTLLANNPEFFRLFFV